MTHADQGSLPVLHPDELRLFCSFIEKQAGLQFADDQRRSSLELSLRARVQTKGFSTFLDYYDFLIRGDPRREELRELLNLVTINETSFFRNVPQFDVFRYEILPKLIERRINTSRTIRIWSAGCATGEEPYTIVMILLDVLKDTRSWRIDVVGTDISQNALWQAQAAIYEPRATRSMPLSFRRRYLRRRPDGRYELMPEVRNMVRFQIGNLIRDPCPLPSPVDIIFCRNVIIYFSPHNIQKVLSTFYDSLAADGYLFVGHAENLDQFTDDFKLLMARDAFVYVKKPLRSARNREHASALSQEHAAAHDRSPTGQVPSALAPDSGQALVIEEARKSCRRDDFRRAENILLPAIESGLRSAEAHLLLAIVHSSTGRETDAIAQAQLALQLDYLCAGAHYILGLIHLGQNRIQQASICFTRAIYSDPNFPLPHFKLAQIREQEADYKNARRHYQNTLRALKGPLPNAWYDFSSGFPPELIRRSCLAGIDRCNRKMVQA